MADINSNTELPDFDDGAAWEAMSTDAFADNLTAKLETAPAMLSCDEMDGIEKYWQDTVIARRCLFVMATKPWKEVRDMVVEDREFAEAVATAIHCVDENAYKGISDYITTAKMRLSVALFSAKTW